MRFRGLPAAGCVLLCGIALLGSACSDNAPLAHTCSATDRQFIDTAQLSMTGLGLTSDQFQQGMGSPKDVASAASLAARNVKATEPSDYSLRQIQALMGAMFTEYARAMNAEAKHKDAVRTSSARTGSRTSRTTCSCRPSRGSRPAAATFRRCSKLTRWMSGQAEACSSRTAGCSSCTGRATTTGACRRARRSRGRATSSAPCARSRRRRASAASRSASSARRTTRSSRARRRCATG